MSIEPEHQAERVLWSGHQSNCYFLGHWIVGLLIVVVLALCPQSRAADAGDLQPLMHQMVEHYRNDFPKWGRWLDEKKVLTSYSPDELVRALINEVELDRNDLSFDRMRNLSAWHLFQALHLPAALVCEELDKGEPPQAKASLIFLLRDCMQPEVTPALLRQIGDKRPAIEPPKGEVEHHPKRYPLRVCDAAFNAIVNNAHNREISSVSFFLGDERKDEIIQENLAKLKLVAP